MASTLWRITVGTIIRAETFGHILQNIRSDSTAIARLAWSGVLDVLKGGSTGDRAVVATLLPRYHNLSMEDSEKVFAGLVVAGLVEALHASNPSVRMAAGEALADLGDTRGIAELRLAVGREQEEVVRLQLEQDLKMLTKKIRQ